jgi:putative DNA primase/helicase
MQSTEIRIALPPRGTDDSGKPLDWDAAYRMLGPDAVKLAFEQAVGWDQLPFDSTASQEEEIDRLAKSGVVEFERQRVKVAQAIGVRSATLDRLVKQRRATTATTGQGEQLFAKPVHWHEPVDGANVLTAFENRVRQHIVLPEYAGCAVALWALFSHAHDAATHSPLLAIQSPAPRCGKTSLMQIVRMVVPSPLAAANIRVAAVYRTVEKYRPTLLLDEADTFVRDSEELRGILNSGHHREFAHVIRMVGEDHEPKQFPTWCPKVIALIGFLPVTLQDRAIAISMRRKAVQENVTKFVGGEDEELAEVRAKFARWAGDNHQRLSGALPELPRGLNDRACDNWRTMIAIADLVGGDWPTRARQAAVHLSGSASDDLTVSTEVQLLADIRMVFREIGRDWVSAQSLTELLCEMEEAPWSEWNRGRCLSARGVSTMLKPFKITSRHTRDGSQYDASMFTEAWNSYLPPDDAEST